MKKLITLGMLCLLSVGAFADGVFDNHFADKTLRIDYIFAGNATTQMVALDELASFEGWAGRKINLDTIPVKVTLDEYIEISKYYSTLGSSTFINGILDKLSTDLVGSGKVVKQGRGLVEI